MKQKEYCKKNPTSIYNKKANLNLFDLIEIFLLQLFRLMCFNVFAHNRDDHSKNFSFLYDDTKKEWHLSPAYDLTYSFSFNGEHATTINDEGKNPTLNDILAVAKNIGLKEKFAKDIALDIQEKCSKLLG